MTTACACVPACLAPCSTFLTLALPHSSETEVKKSKFVTHAWPCSSAEEALELISSRRDPSASHNCWAYKVRGRLRLHTSLPLSQLRGRAATSGALLLCCQARFSALMAAAPLLHCRRHHCCRPAAAGAAATGTAAGPPTASLSLSVPLLQVGQQYRSTDDGEPGGTAGRPILAAIEGEGLDHVALLVIRWA